MTKAQKEALLDLSTHHHRKWVRFPLRRCVAPRALVALGLAEARERLVHHGMLTLLEFRLTVDGRARAKLVRALY